jgi:hypothetical protein
MPRITTLPRTIAGQHLGLDLWYNAKRLFFIEKGLPADFKSRVGYEYALEGKASQAAIEKLLDEAIKVYEEALRQSDDVLVVHASLGYLTMKEMGVIAESGRTEYPLRGGYSGNYHGFNFTYQKLIRVRTGEATIFLKEEPNPFAKEGGEPATRTTKEHVSLDRVYVIEYTPERQAVLDQFIAATAVLGQKMSDFFGKEPEQLLASLDKGQKLLG